MDLKSGLSQLGANTLTNTTGVLYTLNITVNQEGERKKNGRCLATASFEVTILYDNNNAQVPTQLWLYCS